MRTNLANSINSMLKKTRNLPISSMVMATYSCCKKFFIDRGRQVETTMAIGHVYFEVTTKALKMHNQRQTPTQYFPLTR